jgi:hypothetical protein
VAQSLQVSPPPPPLPVVLPVQVVVHLSEQLPAQLLHVPEPEVLLPVQVSEQAPEQVPAQSGQAGSSSSPPQAAMNAATGTSPATTGSILAPRLKKSLRERISPPVGW